MSNDVSNAPDLDDTKGVIALRTPLYPIVSLFGLVMVIATFLTWATIDNPEDPSGGLTAKGLDAGGWGAGALVCGLAIAALGILGYFWNPFSDPEAVFIAGFAIAALVGALVKIADATSLFSDGEALFQYFDTSASAGVGLWLVFISAALSLASAIWILFSRPKAEARLAG